MSTTFNEKENVQRIFFNHLNVSDETKNMMKHYENISLKSMSNSCIFAEVSWIVYASGFRYDIVRKYWPLIKKAYFSFNVPIVASWLDDLERYALRVCMNSGFNNIRKTKWCIQNAGRIIELDVEKTSCGGLKNFLIRISKKPPAELIELAPELMKELNFKGIGKTTIFHLMKNLGMNIFKPDIHVRRILSRLDLIDNENTDIIDVYHAMRHLSEQWGLELNELDTLLFNYGRLNSDKIQKV